MNKKHMAIIAGASVLIIGVLCLGIYRNNKLDDQIEAKKMEIVNRMASRVKTKRDIIDFNLSSLYNLREALVREDIEDAHIKCLASLEVAKRIKLDDRSSQRIVGINIESMIVFDKLLELEEPLKIILHIDNLIETYDEMLDEAKTTKRPALMVEANLQR